MDDASAREATEPATAPVTDDDRPVGLWASGQAAYQTGHRPVHPVTLAGAPVPAGPSAPGADNGTWAPGPYRGTRTRTMVVALVAGLTALAWALCAVAGASILLELPDIAAGAPITQRTLLLDGAWRAIALVALVLRMSTVVVLVAWLSRLVDGLPSLGLGRTKRSPREAIGWWFVPVATWFIPIQILGDALDRLAPTGRFSRILLFTWWSCHLLVLFVTPVINNALVDAQNLERLQTALVWQVAQGALTVVWGTLLVAIAIRAEGMVTRHEQGQMPERSAGPDWGPTA